MMPSGVGMDEATEKQRGWMGGRRIELAELDTSVRRVIFATYAVLLGLALATALHQLFEANGTYLVMPGIAVPKAVAWAAAPGAALAVIFLFAGAAHARTRWKYFLIAPILLAVAVPLAAAPGMVQPPLPPIVKFLFLTPLVFFAACIAVVAVGSRVRTFHVLVLITLLIATYAASLLLLSAAFWSVAPTAVFWVLAIGGVCLYPALVVVGWDLAEICSESASAALARSRSWAPRCGG